MTKPGSDCCWLPLTAPEEDGEETQEDFLDVTRVIPCALIPPAVVRWFSYRTSPLATYAEARHNLKNDNFFFFIYRRCCAKERRFGRKTNNTLVHFNYPCAAALNTRGFYAGETNQRGPYNAALNPFHLQNSTHHDLNIKSPRLN